MSNTLTDENWKVLLERIRNGKCIPFLGAGACDPTLPLGGEIARRLAEDEGYPFDDCSVLPNVAQFLAVKYGDGTYPKNVILNRFFKDIGPPDFSKPDEPHGVLADLPLPIYVTTNYDDFMVQSLRARRKNPVQEFCRWNSFLQGKPSLRKLKKFDPKVTDPLVFHLHGHKELAESLVLTEDDYVDFLINTAKDPDLIPSRIQGGFGDASLLFLGYGLADWNFRVLFRSLVSYLEISISKAHVSVQLSPLGNKVTPEQQQKAQDYLTKRLVGMHIHVFWGTCREFALELRRRWEAFNRVNAV